MSSRPAPSDRPPQADSPARRHEIEGFTIYLGLLRFAVKRKVSIRLGNARLAQGARIAA
nr:hypothetical protein [Candidatus Sigynarchaeota archaeon]